MKKFILLSLLLFCNSCNRNNSVWDEQTTTTHYFNKAKNFFKHPQSDSKLISSEEEFNGREEEFIPLRDEDLRTQSGNFSYSQPADLPTASGNIPGITGFKTPTGDMAALFRTVYFNTDDHILTREEYFGTLRNVARKIKAQPNLYVFVEGHCDERASESYNLALGTRRANFVRTQLIKAGVPKDHVYTVSFGKEKPAVAGNDRVSWAKNRRCEFKIYEKPTLVQNK